MKARDILRIVDSLELGLRSGRDWISVFRWIAENEKNPAAQEWCLRLCQRLKTDRGETLFADLKKYAKGEIESLWIEVLFEIQLGSRNSSALLSSFSKLLHAIDELEYSQKEVAALPRLQMITCLTLSLFLSVVLPFILPNIFTSFINLGRIDLFMFGLSIIIVGVFLFELVILKTKRKYSGQIPKILFFYFISVSLDSGKDLLTSWKTSLARLKIEPKLLEKLHFADTAATRFEDFLEKRSKEVAAPWSEYLTGMLWVKVNGRGVSQYCQKVAEDEIILLKRQWRKAIQSLQFFSLIPLGLCMTPGALFLLVGPQLLQVLDL